MEVMPGDKVETPIWEAYAQIEERYESRGREGYRPHRTVCFLRGSKKAYAIIATGETALYANVMLQKGVVTD